MGVVQIFFCDIGLFENFHWGVTDVLMCFFFFSRSHSFIYGRWVDNVYQTNLFSNYDSLYIFLVRQLIK